MWAAVLSCNFATSRIGCFWTASSWHKQILMQVVWRNTWILKCTHVSSCPSKLYLSWPPGTVLLSSFNFSIENKLHFQNPELKEAEILSKSEMTIKLQKYIYFFCFTYDIIHISMPFFHIIPPSPSPTESKRLFYTSVSLLLSLIQGYCYHLSKFHIYALVYSIGVFLSGLLHSVWSAPVSSTSLELIQMYSF